MRALPKNHEHGWAPYTWLAYFGFFYLQPILGKASWRGWLWTIVGTIAFLLLYFGFFWVRRPWKMAILGGMMACGVLYAPFNPGASCFFIYAAAFVPFVVDSEAAAIKLMAVIPVVVVLETWLLHLSFWFAVYGAGLALVVGGSNIYFAAQDRMNEKLRAANSEIEHLAKVAERERIARDLHDVLGHTLSVIILKSELAGKLIDRDPNRAKAEIADVEQTSRQALAEVRNTIRGYRVQNLQSEWKQATAALETAGIKVESESQEVTLTPAQETVVAMVVREAATNIVRHARARHCTLRLKPAGGQCCLEIADDGCGGEGEGNGIRGMRERVEALGGTLGRETRSGTRLTIQFPLSTNTGNGAS
jgi:two-component system sensor histidine kinase DesK